MEELIRITQLPVIEEHLRAMKEQVETMTSEATALVCTIDTLQAVKATRADLSKRFAVLEEQRKAVKQAILEPYNRFESVYKECVSDPFKSADASLKAKISETEQVVKDEAEAEAREFFKETAKAHNVEWLTYDRMGLNIGMTEAKQKTHKKLKEAITGFITGVSDAVSTIEQMDGADEIMVEFKRCLSLSAAASTVFERHRKLEEERETAEARRKAQEAARQAAARAQAIYDAQENEQILTPPVPAPDPVFAPPAAPVVVAENATTAPAPEKIYKLAFAVHGTKPQLIQFKAAFINYCEKEGLRYE